MIKRIKRIFFARKYFVILDPLDNSITLSKALFTHIKNKSIKNEAKVFVFRTEGTFGFMVNPEIEQATQLCEIQYNDKYKCIGFETLCPSVGQILYDFKMNGLIKAKFSISIEKTKDNKIYYKINKPR